MDAVGPTGDAATRNALLGALPVEARGMITAGSRVVHLEQRGVLWEPGQDTRHVDFPPSEVISLENVMNAGDMVEFATVGREGMVGLHHFQGSPSKPSQ